ncbi:MAG: DEAD/DEAH box helicase family protein [Anaerovoracaceae bacterium]
MYLHNKAKIGYLSKDNEIVIVQEKCDDTIFSNIIGRLQQHNFEYELKYDPFRIALSVDYREKLSSVLVEFSRFVEVTEKFKEWISKIRMKTVKISVGPVFSKILPCRAKLPIKDIEDVTKYFFKPAVRKAAYKDKRWDGYIHLYNKYDKSFPTGLIDLVESEIIRAGLVVDKIYTHDTAPPRMFNWEVDDDIIPEPDQIEAIEACYYSRRGVCKAPTGFGKTAVLAKRLTVKFAVPTIFLANKKSLLDDAAEEFRTGISGVSADDVIQIKDGWFGNIKLTPDMTSEDIPDIKAPIIVATIQSLSARLEDHRTRGSLERWLMNKCKFVMVDETQAIGTKIWDDVLGKIQAPYRIFLSATPRRTDGATLKLNAYSGPIVYTTTADEQIRKGRLCDLDIQCRIYDHKIYNENDADLVYADEYKERIVYNTDRNINGIIKPAMELIGEDRHILILIQSIEHGHAIRNLMIENGLPEDQVRFIWGDVSDKVRQQTNSDFKSGKFRVLIGSTIFDAGVNLPLIGGVILAGAGNSDITLIQRIGRGARNCDFEKAIGRIPEYVLKNDGIKRTKVIDVADINVIFFSKQSKNRYYNAREEFGKNRVSIVGSEEKNPWYRKKVSKSKVSVQQSDEDQLRVMAEFSQDKNNEGSVLNKLDADFANFLKTF